MTLFLRVFLTRDKQLVFPRFVSALLSASFQPQPSVVPVGFLSCSKGTKLTS